MKIFFKVLKNIRNEDFSINFYFFQSRSGVLKIFACFTHIVHILQRYFEQLLSLSTVFFFYKQMYMSLRKM